MEVKRRTARSLVKRLGSSSSSTAAADDQAQVDDAICEIRLLSKHDPDSRVLLADAGAVPLLAHHLLLLSSASNTASNRKNSSTNSQENAAAALLNLSISGREQLMSTPGLLDALSATLRRPCAPSAAQHAAATLFSLLSVDAYRPIIGAKSDIVSSLVNMLKPAPHPPPTRSIKDALKALFGISLYPLNRAAVVKLGAVPALFSLLVKDGRTGIVEDCTAVVAQVAGCEESVDAFQKVSGARVLVDLVDAATGSSARARENAASALLNLAMSGGERAVGDIREVETAVDAVRDLAETGASARAKTKAGALLRILIGQQQQQWLGVASEEAPSSPSAEDDTFYS